MNAIRLKDKTSQRARCGGVPAKAGLLAVGSLITLLLQTSVKAQDITSNAVAYGSNDPGPIPQMTTHKAAEVVSDSGSASFFVSNSRGSASGTANSSAQATTELGLNRVALTGALSAYDGTTDGLFGAAWANCAAYSYWSDQVKVTGGAVGDPVTLRFSGRTIYDLTFGGGAFAAAGNPAVSLEQAFNASSAYDAGQKTISTSDFVAEADQGFVDWTLNISARAGDTINLVMSVNTEMNPSYWGVDHPGYIAKSASFDSSHTALLTGLDVTNGYGLSDASGALMAYGDGFAYKAVIAELEGGGPILAVPEPGSYALMVGGLACLGYVARRRGRAGR